MSCAYHTCNWWCVKITPNKQHRTGHRIVVGSIVTLHFGVLGLDLHIQHIYRVFILKFLWKLPAHVGGCWASTSQFFTLFPTRIFSSPHSHYHTALQHHIVQSIWHVVIRRATGNINTIIVTLVLPSLCREYCAKDMSAYWVCETTESLSLIFRILH